MKKVIILLCVILGITAISAQERNQERDQTRLMKVDGDVLQIQDRDQIRLQDKITLNDGSVLNPDGTVQTRNQEKLNLREGECIDMDGMRYRNEYKYRSKVKREIEGLSQNQMQERNQNRVHFMLMDGEVYQIRTQSQNRLQKQIYLSNGGVMDEDGNYLSPNREQFRLRDGQCINMEGKKFKNTYQYRKMMLNKPKMMKRGVKKAINPKKKSKRITSKN